uniref:Uncharacterized protein n=1 Tax=Physcomitrium patens TaxID=3218 RepID=A0A7I4DP70_PHYPA
MNTVRALLSPTSGTLFRSSRKEPAGSGGARTWSSVSSLACKSCSKYSIRAVASYIKQRGYDLHSVETYDAQGSGFINVLVEDLIDQLVEVLKNELPATEQAHDKFVEEF